MARPTYFFKIFDTDSGNPIIADGTYKLFYQKTTDQKGDLTFFYESSFVNGEAVIPTTGPFPADRSDNWYCLIYVSGYLLILNYLRFDQLAIDLPTDIPFSLQSRSTAIDNQKSFYNNYALQYLVV
jgi:hypothetical protein